MEPITLPAPTLEHVCDLLVNVSPPIEVGQTPFGMRRVVPITGGVVRGPRMNGRVLDAGADFQLVLEGNTMAHLDARYVIELDDGARIWVHNTALRVASEENARRLLAGQTVNPDEIYFRCQPRLEAAAPAWHWLNQSQFVGCGRRAPTGVNISIYRMA